MYVMATRTLRTKEGRNAEIPNMKMGGSAPGLEDWPRK